jgi:hypothetical protein
LSNNHVIPSAAELKKWKYCKWHNSSTHDTNDCIVFRKEIQQVIDQGRIELEDSNSRPMKIDGHPFPQVSMIRPSKGKGIKSNESASDRDTNSGRFNHKASSSKQLGRVTSQMLLDKYTKRCDLHVGKRRNSIGENVDIEKNKIGALEAEINLTKNIGDACWRLLIPVFDRHFTGICKVNYQVLLEFSFY